MKNNVVRNWIAIAVVFVWMTLALATLFTKDYTALGTVTPVMMIVVGFLFGFRESFLPYGNKNDKESEG